MAKSAYRDPSLDDSHSVRDIFSKCKDDLIQNTDFDVMYEKLNDTDIGRKRMSSIFVLRAYSRGDNNQRSSLARSQKLYNAISKEKDEYFAQWFNAIMLTLSRTGNENNGKHQEVLEKISGIQASKNNFMMACTVPINVIPVRKRKEIKIILLGHSGSGKSRFLQRAIGNVVEETSATVGMDFGVLEFQYQDTAVKVTVWDTGGQERFGAITKSYYRDSNGALIFIDLSQFNEPADREDVILYTESLMENLENAVGKIPCLLIGAKYDLVGQLSDEVIKALKKLADSCSDGKVICTSAKTGFHVQDAVSVIIELVMSEMSSQQDVEYNTEKEIIKLPVNTPTKCQKQRVKGRFRRFC